MYTSVWKVYSRIFLTLLIFIFLAAILYPQLSRGFVTNPGLNGLIIAFLVSGWLQSLWIVNRIAKSNKFLQGIENASDITSRQRQSIPDEISSFLILIAANSEKTSLSIIEKKSVIDMIIRKLGKLRNWGWFCILAMPLFGFAGAAWSMVDIFNGLSILATAGPVQEIPPQLTVDALKDLNSGITQSFFSVFLSLMCSFMLAIVHYYVIAAHNDHISDLERSVFDL